MQVLVPHDFTGVDVRWALAITRYQCPDSSDRRTTGTSPHLEFSADLQAKAFKSILAVLRGEIRLSHLLTIPFALTSANSSSCRINRETSHRREISKHQQRAAPATVCSVCSFDPTGGSTRRQERTCDMTIRALATVGWGIAEPTRCNWPGLSHSKIWVWEILVLDLASQRNCMPTPSFSPVGCSCRKTKSAVIRARILTISP